MGPPQPNLCIDTSAAELSLEQYKNTTLSVWCYLHSCCAFLHWFPKHILSVLLQNDTNCWQIDLTLPALELLHIADLIQAHSQLSL